MELRVRRVVTGHDAEGKATVIYDSPTTDAVLRRPGHISAVLWTTDDFPVSNEGHDDTAKRPVDSTLRGGTIFRLVEFHPGLAPRVHRTDSIDYAVVLSGSIDMEMDDGVEVHLEAGDVLVQRGTVHNWINRGDKPCRIAFVLVSADPVKVGGDILAASG